MCERYSEGRARSGDINADAGPTSLAYVVNETARSPHKIALLRGANHAHFQLVAKEDGAVKWETLTRGRALPVSSMPSLVHPPHRMDVASNSSLIPNYNS